MLSPALLVQDIDKSIEFYTKTLGFEEVARLPGPSGYTVHGHVQWKDVNFMFGLTASLSKEALPYLGTGVEFYISSGEEGDIDQFYNMLKEKGVTIIKEINDMFWGDRAFTIADLDGYQLMFAKKVREVSPEDMLKAMKQMDWQLGG